MEQLFNVGDSVVNTITDETGEIVKIYRNRVQGFRYQVRYPNSNQSHNVDFPQVHADTWKVKT